MSFAEDTIWGDQYPKWQHEKEQLESVLADTDKYSEADKALAAQRLDTVRWYLNTVQGEK